MLHRAKVLDIMEGGAFLRRMCQLTLTRIARQVSHAFYLKNRGDFAACGSIGACIATMFGDRFLAGISCKIFRKEYKFFTGGADGDESASSVFALVNYIFLPFYRWIKYNVNKKLYVWWCENEEDVLYEVWAGGSCKIWNDS